MTTDMKARALMIALMLSGAAIIDLGYFVTVAVLPILMTVALIGSFKI